MKIFTKIFSLLIFINVCSIKVSGVEHLNMQITNCVATANEIQFDFMLLNDGDQPLKLNSGSFRMTHSATIVPAGTNTYSFTYVGGSDFPGAFLAIPSTYNVNYTATSRLMQLTMSTGNYTSSTAISIPVGGPAKRVGRFSLKITNANWVTSASVGIAYSVNGNGAVMYVNGSNLSSVMGQSSPSIFSTTPPCALTIPTSCNITSSTSGINDVTCYAGTNGSATITLTNASAPVTWNLNGVTVSGNGTSNTFSNLAYGNNSVSFTDATSCTGIQNFSIGGPLLPMTVIGCSHTDVPCHGSNGTVTAGTVFNSVGTTTFSWRDSVGTFISSNATVTQPPGTYTLMVTDNCSSTTCTETISQAAAITSDYSSTACDAYNLPWGGSVTSPGDYSHTYPASGGCDSIVTAHVLIKNSTSSSYNDTAIDVYYLPWGDTATTSGSYVFTYAGLNGCDSNVTAQIVILPLGTGIEEGDLTNTNLYSISENSIILSNKITKAELFTQHGQSIRMNNLNPGIYFLRVIFNKKLITYKIIINTKQ